MLTNANKYYSQLLLPRSAQIALFPLDQATQPPEKLVILNCLELSILASGWQPPSLSCAALCTVQPQLVKLCF